MLPQEEQEILTRTGPGTPGGNLMRRYWQPAALSEELPPGGPPLSIRLLGEDLVLFRDEHGRPGLLGIHCAHRGADLSYGRIEDGGLRCLYHGWLYDRAGHCLEQPGEPSNSWTYSGERDSTSSSNISAQDVGGSDEQSSQAGAASTFHERIRHIAYPCEERAGAIFAYLGPGEPPLFPNYEFLTMPDEQVIVTKLWHECNYLQANEGNIDLSHLTFLHYTARNQGIGGGRNNAGGRPDGFSTVTIDGRGAAPAVEIADAELTRHGVRSYKVRRDFGPDQYQLYLTEFVLPNFTAFPGASRGDGGFGINWHVPIDDVNHWKYTFAFHREHAIDQEGWGHNWAVCTAGYRPTKNKANRYLQDRASMKTEVYTGIGFDFVIHDLWATEGQGPIQDRSNEHLGAMDRAVLASRRVLLKAILDLQEGVEPSNVVRDPSRNAFRIIARNGVFPESKSWKVVAGELEAEVRV
ncbi:MAG: Rieske 2Fe-2S domain-containing protein [Chloroflexi bacterium]|nr:Rieske 2Fe-2S domain-containing protein [Chloroflexota bacterium]